MEEYKNRYGDTIKFGDPIAISYGSCFVYGIFHSCTHTLKFWTMRTNENWGWARLNAVQNKADVTMRDLNNCLDYIYGDSMHKRVIKLNRECLSGKTLEDYDMINKILENEYQNSWAAN